MHRHGHDDSPIGDQALTAAVVINLLLTVVEVVGGIIAGSLALIADALHNFSDAGSLLVAWIARKVGKQKADAKKNFWLQKSRVCWRVDQPCCAYYGW